MTPEREASIRKIAARDGESWRSSKVSNLALREIIAEVDALRAEVAMLRDSSALYRDEVATLIRERDAARSATDALRVESE